MTHEQILDYCLQKPGTFTDYPFGFITPVVKVGMLHGKNRIIAQLLTLHGEPKVTLSCAPEAAADFRSRYPGSVVRGCIVRPYSSRTSTPSASTGPCRTTSCGI